MIELFNILFFSIFLSILFFIPFINKTKISSRKLILDSYDLRTLNILLLFNLIIIFVILNLKISQIISIFYSLIFIFIIYFLINFKKFTFQKNIYFYFLILFVLSINLSNNLTLYWDGQKLWLPKAIIFYNNGYISDLSSTAYSHYSFLGSLLWAFFWKISSFEYEYFGRVFFFSNLLFCII